MSGRSSFSFTKRDAPASLLYPMFSELIEDNNLRPLQQQQQQQQETFRNAKRARRNVIIGPTNDTGTTSLLESEQENESTEMNSISDSVVMEGETSPSQETVENQNHDALLQKNDNDANDDEKDKNIYSPLQQQQRRQQNVLHQLHHRSTTGATLRSLPAAAFKTWSPWALLLDTSGGNGSNAAAAVVTCTAWDHVGVLLAVAFTNKTIQVYDWDVVSRIQPRYNNNNNNNNKRPRMEPMCIVKTPHVVTFLQWNSHDCLVTCFRGSSQVRVYDMAHVVETSNNDSSCWTILSHPAIQSEAIAAQCLPRRQWLVSYRDGHVVLYKIKSNNNNTNSTTAISIQWKWKHGHYGFSHILPLQQTSNNVLLVGATNHTWIQLDYKKCTRGAFSTEKSPTVVKKWNFSGKYGSVVSIQVVNETPSFLECKYITSYGWILGVTLDASTSSTTRVSQTVIHAPPRVLLDTGSEDPWTGNAILKESTQHYSQPLHAMSAQFSHPLLVWTTVQPVTHVLPHHDRRHVGGSLQVVHSRQSSISILIMDTQQRNDVIVELPMQHPTTCLTLHPCSNHEWLVVGNIQGELQVWTARDLSSSSKRQRRNKRQISNNNNRN